MTNIFCLTRYVMFEKIKSPLPGTLQTSSAWNAFQNEDSARNARHRRPIAIPNHNPETQINLLQLCGRWWDFVFVKPLGIQANLIKQPMPTPRHGLYICRSNQWHPLYRCGSSVIERIPGTSWLAAWSAVRLVEIGWFNWVCLVVWVRASLLGVSCAVYNNTGSR